MTRRREKSWFRYNIISPKCSQYVSHIDQDFYLNALKEDQTFAPHGTLRIKPISERGIFCGRYMFDEN
jgi:hypothetical protein